MTAPPLDPPVDLAADHWRGGGPAAATLLLFGDYECPYSATAFANVLRLERELGDGLRFVFRHLPLIDLHPHALAAAGFAEAAARQGRFWDMHELLFARRQALEVDDLRGYAAELGLDGRRLVADLEDHAMWRKVQADVESARASGAPGTPTFFVDGVRHDGTYDVTALRAALGRP
ncbi:MAG TPA: thioredoxin domain-containing protein [Solirubrobacteraceae bacterium]|nr:thioredoxin domain-containing protein [Solirubrobacteraceae bacterium]